MIGVDSFEYDSLILEPAEPVIDYLDKKLPDVLFYSFPTDKKAVRLNISWTL